MKIEIWTKNDTHYLMIGGKAAAWDHDYDAVKTLADRMAGRHLPMVPEFKTFLPVPCSKAWPMKGE